jgi:tetratricopeptide (TPR) repeat protein
MKILIAFLILLITINNNIYSQTTNKLTATQREDFIQKANKLRAIELYTAAATFLDSILIDNPKDAPILLYKGDLMLQAKLYANAAQIYETLLPLNYETTITKINLSYALFMSHKTRKALHFANDAWTNDKTNVNAIVNFFNAQLWNIKTNDAEAFLNSQLQNLPAHQTLILKARLYTTKGNFSKGLQYYDSATKSHDSKFYAQEYAEVLIGKKEYKKAAVVIEQNKTKFQNSEYTVLLQKLKVKSIQYAGTEISYFTDIANNVRFENKFWWQQAEEKKYQLNLAFGYGSIQSNKTEKSTTQFVQAQVNENWSTVLKGETKINFQKIKSNNNNDFNVLTAQQLIKYQPNDRRMIGLFVRRELLNFTSSLLDKGITNTSYGYITHLMLKDKIGFFSEGSYANISDNNSKLQFFGSLYTLLRTEPTLKTGLNFTALHFTDSSIKNYFSPNKYLHSELFVDFSTPLPQSNNFFLQLQAATGFQKIENRNWENASRLQAEIGYRKKLLETTFKFQTSNVSSNNGTGYSFYWYTLNFRWKF